MSTEELYQQIVKYLDHALSSETYASMRSRYSNDGDKAEEVINARNTAKKCWMAAKTLYCENKEELDKLHESTLHKSSFSAMRDVIEKEAKEEMEKVLRGKSE